MTGDLIIELRGARYAWTGGGWRHLSGPDYGPLLPYIHGAQSNPVRWMVEQPAAIRPWIIVQRPEALPSTPPEVSGRVY